MPKPTDRPNPNPPDTNRDSTGANHQIILTPSNRRFASFGTDTLLEAGLRSGIALPFECAGGSCGACQARVVRGTVRRTQHHDYTFSAVEKQAGMCLMCCTSACGDVTLEVLEAQSTADIPEQSLRATLCKCEWTADVCVCAFRFTRGRAMRYLAGQQATLELPGAAPVSLPIASCPCNRGYIEFHIPNDQKHQTLRARLESLTPRQRVTVAMQTQANARLDGWLQAPQRARIFIVWGEHFARVRGLIEHLLNLEVEQPISLLWLATPSCSQYQHNLCRSWADAYDEFDYQALAHEASAIQTLRSHIEAADLNSELLLCGPREQTQSLHKQWVRRYHCELFSA